MRNYLKEEQRCLRISLIMVMLLMVWGLAFSEATDSNIVKLDAGSYIISGLIGIITIYVSKLQRRPSDRVHPFGYTGFVPILNLMRSFMILLICVKAISSSVGDLANGPVEAQHDSVLIYALVTLLINGIAFLYLRRAYKRTGSDILKVDAMEWKIDIYFNLCVLLSLSLSFAFERAGYQQLADHTDPVSCIILSVVMSIMPLKMFRENIRKLSVAAVDKETHNTIRQRFYKEIPHMQAFNPHMTTIDMSGVLWVELEFDHRKEMINTQSLRDLEEKGKAILSEISVSYHLTFNLADA
jgi:divalent metal cation (Fe/Co/Zn/Cd) transporter